MKIKFVKLALLSFVFFFMGALNVNAQTAAELGSDQTKAVLLNLRSAGVSFNAELADVKTGEITGQDATNVKHAQKYYSAVMTAFIGGADLSQTMESALVKPNEQTSRLSFISETEMQALHNQILEIKNSDAAMVDLDDFNILFANSKNN